jgi:hypothetical protein
MEKSLPFPLMIDKDRRVHSFLRRPCCGVYFPWGGTYVNNNGINIALLFQQRMRFRRQGLRFFG